LCARLQDGGHWIHNAQHFRADILDDNGIKAAFVLPSIAETPTSVYLIQQSQSLAASDNQ
jgi:hypothetical protein